MPCCEMCVQYCDEDKKISGHKNSRLHITLYETGRPTILSVVVSFFVLFGIYLRLSKGILL
jgi:hypothetical protein